MAREFSDELLSAYLDGELSAAERAVVESRLAADPEARQLLDELRVLSSEVRGLPRYAAGDGFAQRVVQAALAAKADQNGSIQTAQRDKSSLRRKSRSVWWSAALAGAGTVAAALMILAWSQGWLARNVGAGGVVKGPESSPQPEQSPLVQVAVASLRQAIPKEGQAVVIRICLGENQSPSQALDAALTKAGIGSRLATDTTTGAMSVAKAYRDQLAQKFGGQQPGVPNTALDEATTAVADAVFVEAPLAAVEQALVVLAAEPKSALELSPLMSVVVGKSAADAGGEGDTRPNQVDRGPLHYAQRLSASLFRLEKNPPAPATSPPAAAIDASKPVRVLILIERTAK
jgi:putative zinc finger protein